MSDRTLVFDCETTGKVFFKLPVDHASQPRLLQIAALLHDGDNEIAAFKSLVVPDGFTVPDDATAIHGITTDYATKNGLPIGCVLRTFRHLLGLADTIVAHNIDFDRFIIRGEYARYAKDDPTADKNVYCTMRSSTDICNIPGPYGLKWPKLQEAYEFAFGTQMEGCHDAMVDVKATWRVYKWLRDKCVERNPASYAGLS